MTLATLGAQPWEYVMHILPECNTVCLPLYVSVKILLGESSCCLPTWELNTDLAYRVHFVLRQQLGPGGCAAGPCQVSWVAREMSQQHLFLTPVSRSK